MLLTQQRYEVAGGSLTLLSARERQALDRLALACSDYARDAPAPMVTTVRSGERPDSVSAPERLAVRARQWP
jgi:hypothetical protein